MFRGFRLQGQQASLGQTLKQEVTKLSSVLGPFSSWKFGDIYGIVACSRAFPHYTRVIGTRAIHSFAPPKPSWPRVCVCSQFPQSHPEYCTER